MTEVNKLWSDSEGLKIIDESIHTSTEYTDTRRWDSWVEPTINKTKSRFIDHFGRLICTAIALEADRLRISRGEKAEVSASSGSFYLSGDYCPTDSWTTKSILVGGERLSIDEEFRDRYLNFYYRGRLADRSSDRYCLVCPIPDQMCHELANLSYIEGEGKYQVLRFNRNTNECTSQMLEFEHVWDKLDGEGIEKGELKRNGRCVYDFSGK